jgi:hypothetical protein
MAQIFEKAVDPNCDKQIAKRADGVWFERYVSMLGNSKASRWQRSADQNPLNGMIWHERQHAPAQARLPKV